MKPPTSRQVDSWMATVRRAVQEFVGRPLSERDVLKLAALAAYRVSKSAVDRNGIPEAAYATLEHLDGATCDERTLLGNMTRLLANWHFVAEGLAVPEWDGTPTTSDLVVIGVSRERYRLSGGSPGRLAKVKLKTGLCAGIITCTALYDSASGYFVGHDSGAASYGCTAEEISGMELKALVSAAPSGMVSLKDMKTSSGQKKHNRDLADRRSDPLKCGNPVPCNACAKTCSECPLGLWLTDKEEK